jgi:O-methyltransferase domain
MSTTLSADFRDANPNATVWDIVRGLSRFGAVHAMVDLRCADHLKKDGPLTTEELSARCNADPVQLGRVLRMTAALGLLTQVSPGRYGLTASGETLCEDSPNSMRPAVLAHAEEGSWIAMNAIPQTVRIGRTRFMEEYGSHYDYLAAHPEANEVFNEFMRLRSEPGGAAVATRYDFTEINSLVDVGGGKGTLLAAILQANRVRERDQVIPDAKANLTARGLADRCEFVVGDFFRSAPKGADAYLLGSVIHNWDDAVAARILETVRAAVPDHGRVLLVDAALPDDDRPHVGKELDVRMMVLFGGGRERTESEYFGLLTGAGLNGRIVAALPIGLSLIEALPTT